MSTPPLHWSIDVHAIHSPAVLAFEAKKHELDAIKRYAEVEDVTSFKSEIEVTPLSGGKFRVTGELHADAVQASVADLSAVPASISEHFSAEYWPEELIADEDAKTLSFEEDAPEAIFHGRILIGEFLCELLSVSLDPYPRNPGDKFEWRQEGEPPANAFAKLARFRPRKKSDGA